MRPVILVFTGYYIPSYRAGGPVRTISNLVDRLAGDFDFRIVTRDRDIGDGLAFDKISVGEWVEVGKAKVMYVNASRLRIRDVARIVRDTPHDVLYLNSFFDPVFTIPALLARRFGRLPGRPVVLAPRGEFSRGALGIKSTKKRVYIRLARLLRLYQGVTWQASSEYEIQDIRRAFVGTAEEAIGSIKKAENMTQLQDAQKVLVASVDKESCGLRVCALARISPMKNLLFSLRILSRVSVPVVFSVYGPIEDEAYWGECQVLVGKLPKHINFQYMGQVGHSDVMKILQEHDLFFMPTLGENFGHVIYESLRAGLPVLISDQTPWRDLERKGVGWDIALTDEARFVRQIEEFSGLTLRQRQELSDRAAALARSISEDSGVLDRNKALFLDCIDNFSRGGGGVKMESNCV